MPSISDFISALSVLVAVIAVALSLWQQRKLQERQLRQALFQERFNVFNTIMDTFASEGRVRSYPLEYGIVTFRPAVMKLRYLFDESVLHEVLRLHGESQLWKDGVASATALLGLKSVDLSPHPKQPSDTEVADLRQQMENYLFQK